MKELLKVSPPEVLEIIKDIRKYDDLVAKNEFLTLTNTVSLFKDEIAFRMLIEFILNDSLILDEVIMNSYRHQNGFHKIVFSKGAVYKMRLHIFENMSEITMPMENIHNHRWNFASQIIKGRLRMETFKTSEDVNNLYFDYCYKPANGRNKYEVRLIGLTSLDLFEVRNYNSGEFYYMGCEELHRIINIPDQRTVTIVMTGIPKNNQCKLFSASVFMEKQKEVLRYSRNELVKLLETL